MNHPLVCIVVLNWNALKETIECMDSLQKIRYPQYKLIIVDNASSNNEAHIFRQMYSEVADIILAKENYGYTGGNNIGMEYAIENYNPDFILILNNDIIVDPDFLNHLIKVAQSDPKIGIVGGKVYYHKYPDLIQSAGIGLNMYTGKSYHIGYMKFDKGQYDYQRIVNIVMGCCMLIKREVIDKIGLLDEQYFCYKDDIDYCYKCSKAGYDVVYTPLAKIWHKNYVKLKIWERTQSKNKRSAFTQYLLARNNFMFMKKHANRLQRISFFIYFFTLHFIFQTGVCLIFHRDFKRYLAMCRGALDGIKYFFISTPGRCLINRKKYISITK